MIDYILLMLCSVYLGYIARYIQETGILKL